MIKFKVSFILLMFLFALPANIFPQAAGYKVTGKIIIGGGAGWDYLSIYKPANLLFVSHKSEVDVISLENNQVVGKIEGLEGVHGIAVAGDFNKGYISDGHANSIVVFDLKSFKTTAVIKSTGEDPDAIVYDPFTKRIFAFNGNSTTATAIDAAADSVIGTVELTGSPEFGVSDFKGRMYVNIEKKDAIDVINPETLKVIDTWVIPPCKGTSAMAIDRAGNRLFIGARNKTFAAVNAETGKVIADFPIGPGVDACGYDPETGLIFCSNKDATMSVIKQDSPDKYEFIGNITTLPGAKTLTLDEHTHRVYTSTMITDKDGNKSFGVLIIDKQ